MSWAALLNGTDQRFDVPHQSSLDIIRSNGSQAYAVWIDAIDNDGVAKNVISNDVFGTTGSFQVIVRGDDISRSRQLDFWVRTSFGSLSAVDWSASNYLIVAQYNSSTSRYEISLCAEGGTNERVSFTANYDITKTDWKIGCRGGNTNYFSGFIFKFAKIDDYLDDEAIESLASDFNNITKPANTVHYYDPDASDRSSTGTQPVLTNSDSDNDASGVNFATDGSIWYNFAEQDEVVTYELTAVHVYRYSTTDSVELSTLNLVQAVDVIRYSTVESAEISVTNDSVVFHLNALETERFSRTNTISLSTFVSLDAVSTDRYSTLESAVVTVTNDSVVTHLNALETQRYSTTTSTDLSVQLDAISTIRYSVTSTVSLSIFVSLDAINIERYSTTEISEVTVGNIFNLNPSHITIINTTPIYTILES